MLVNLNMIGWWDKAKHWWYVGVCATVKTFPTFFLDEQTMTKTTALKIYSVWHFDKLSDELNN